MSNNIKKTIAVIFLYVLCLGAWAADSLSIGGHTKYRALYTQYPNTSLYQQFIGDDATDHSADIRVKLNWQPSAWALQADYQLIHLQSDALETSPPPALTMFPGSAGQDDDHRLFDLTHRIHAEGDSILSHRFDRLYLGYTSEKIVARIDRQAVSWGNGLIYAPMDFFNPFDPAAVDKEYKTGDDMLYGQYLLANGDDLQAVSVARRNDQGKTSSSVASTALKYHGVIGNSEYDLLIAQHYNDSIAGFGGNTALGGAVWHGDITVTKTDNDTVTSLVTGLSHSWVWGTTNYSGTIEYFYNGFGVDQRRIEASALLQNPDLLNRIQRGELFTLGKEYIAASASIELTPLWLMTPLLFHNLSDRSSLLQILSQHDLAQNLQLLLAIDIPMGSSGTEYGGMPSGTDNLELSIDKRVFMQLGWYF